MTRKSYTGTLDSLVAEAAIALGPASGASQSLRDARISKILNGSISRISQILKGRSKNGSKVNRLAARIGIAKDYRSDISSRLSRMVSKGLIGATESRFVKQYINNIIDVGDRHHHSAEKSAERDKQKSYTARLEGFKDHYHANLKVADNSAKTEYIAELDRLTEVMSGKKVRSYSERTTGARAIMYDLSSKLLGDVKSGKLTSKEAHEITQATGNIIRTGFDSKYAKKKYASSATSLERLNSRISNDFGIEAMTGVPANLVRMLARNTSSMTIFKSQTGTDGINTSQEPITVYANPRDDPDVIELPVQPSVDTTRPQLPGYIDQRLLSYTGTAANENSNTGYITRPIFSTVVKIAAAIVGTILLSSVYLNKTTTIKAQDYQVNGRARSAEITVEKIAPPTNLYRLPSNNVNL